MKYEIFQAALPGEADMTVEVGVMHNDHLTHSVVAAAMLAAIAECVSTPVENVSVVSAGFCTEGFPVRCWGKSESLNMSSRMETDEHVLMSSMLRFEAKPHSTFEAIDWCHANAVRNRTEDFKALKEKVFLLANDLKLEVFGTGCFETVDAVKRMVYLGPSVNEACRPVHLFKFIQLYEVTHTRIFAFTEQQMCSVFEETPTTKAILYTNSCAMEGVNKQMGVYQFGTLFDPYPLTDDHDDIRLEMICLKTKKTHIVVGTLSEIAAKLNLDVEE